MDLALQLVVEMNQWIWSRFKDDLKDATPEEIDWRPLPQANNIGVIVRHLRIEAVWHLASLEHDEPMPVQLTDHVRQQVDLNLSSGVSRPMHLLGFHQATHLATHLGQIRSILNLYLKTRGEAARFSPENLSFPL